MPEILPWEKKLSEVLSRNMNLGDLGYLTQTVLTTTMKLGGLAYAAAGFLNLATESQHPVRDGLLIYTGGKLIDFGYRATTFLEDIYKRK